VSVPAIVFSRDRAAQLDLLLSSLAQRSARAFDPVTVLWRASAEDFHEAYRRCESDHAEVEFVAEQSFASDLASLLPADGPLVFFCDDSVLFRPLAGRDPPLERWAEVEAELLCFSLRLGRNCTWCYPYGHRQRLPSFSEHGDVLVWSWPGADGDFGYPMSLDGHIMGAGIIRHLLAGHAPTNPNTLEAALAQAAIGAQVPERMASYRQSHLVGIPVNRVNETHANRFGERFGLSEHALNERYLGGERLDLARMSFASVAGAHSELAFGWRRPRRRQRPAAAAADRGARAPMREPPRKPALALPAGDSVSLVTVVSGEVYERYAEALLESARGRFHPARRVELVRLQGRDGWPAATLYRYHALSAAAARLRGEFIFLVDADMRFEGHVGPEILAPLVATRHPGYMLTLPGELPYERDPSSSAYVAPGEGSVYYAGGFVGGQRKWMLDLAARIAAGVDHDQAAGVVARWHDESHLNRCLLDTPPFRVLSPAYCYPEDDAHYLPRWRERHLRLLVAIEKHDRTGREPAEAR
jgi:Glycosyltransferase family 6